MHYKLLSEAPEEQKKLLELPTEELFLMALPNVPPPSEYTSFKEVQYLRHVMANEYKLNKDFIIACDVDIVGVIAMLGDELGMGSFEDLKEELTEISDALSILILKIKWYYNRARPFQYAEKMGVSFPKFQTETGHTPSYPSGHTIQAYFLAAYLSEQFPQHTKIMMDLAKDISFSRIQCGVHFPSDIAFGVAIYRTLWNDVSPTIYLP